VTSDDPRANRGGSPRYRTAQAAVVDILRERILSGELAPGTRLLQTEIAEQFEMSTTPVREALRQLAAEGLLDGDPHRGVTVHRTSLKELEDVYELRLVLEPMAMGATARKITPEVLEVAEDLVEQMEAVRDPAAWISLNAEFHRVLAEAADRPRLATIIDNLRAVSAVYIATSIRGLPKRRRAANAEHRELIDACRSGDIERAQEIERRHLQHTLELGKKAIAEA